MEGELWGRREAGSGQHERLILPLPYFPTTAEKEEDEEGIDGGRGGCQAAAPR
jgi:hypothetical protein